MKRILIYSSQSLFGQGVKTLLDAHPTLDVIGWETDATEAVQSIREMQPDVVLVVTKDSSTDLTSDEQRFLGAGTAIRIVELNLADNNVRVYCGEQRCINEVADLVRAIEEPVSGAPVKPSKGSPPKVPKEQDEE